MRLFKIYSYLVQVMINPKTSRHVFFNEAYFFFKICKIQHENTLISCCFFFVFLYFIFQMLNLNLAYLNTLQRPILGCPMNAFFIPPLGSR